MIIRDYIYQDVNRLKSIYAQANGGLLETITASEQTEEHTNRAEGLISQVKRDALFETGRTETRILHDYLYTEVEKRLSGQIRKVTSESIGQLQAGDFVQVSGTVEIDEPERLVRVMDNYDKFLGGLLMGSDAANVQRQLWALEEELEKLDNAPKGQNVTQRRKQIEQQMRSLTPQALTKKLKKGLPQITVENVKNWYDILYRDVLEMRFVPWANSDTIFRAIIFPEYLREQLQILYAKYGSRTQVNLTLVGQVTTVFLPEKLGSPSDTEDVTQYLKQHNVLTAVEVENSKTLNDSQTMDASAIDENSDANIRDAIEVLYTTISEIERFLLVSNRKKSVVTTPLVIYSETSS